MSKCNLKLLLDYHLREYMYTIDDAKYTNTIDSYIIKCIKNSNAFALECICRISFSDYKKEYYEKILLQSAELNNVVCVKFALNHGACNYTGALSKCIDKTSPVYNLIFLASTGDVQKMCIINNFTSKNQTDEAPIDEYWCWENNNNDDQYDMYDEPMPFLITSTIPI